MTDADPVAEAFAHLQKAAHKRTATPPERRKGASIRKGIPTGPDGRRRRRPLTTKTVGSVLGKEIRQRGWQKHIAGGWVNAHWADLVGPQIAEHTRIEMLKDTTLFVTCDSTAWATNLRLMQRKILQVIAEKAGPNVITELKFFGPRPPSWRKGRLHVKGRGPRDTYG